MKILSFNINGIRARPHQLEALVASHQPDIIGLQEIKCPDTEFPHATLTELGYHAAWFGQKSHYGVALLSKQAPIQVQKGFPGDAPDAQRRMIAGSWQLVSGTLHVVNGYFPQGDSRAHAEKYPAKQRFYADLATFLETTYSPQDRVVVLGDFNVAPVDGDIGIGPVNAKRWLKEGKCAFLPEERAWFNRLESWGLVDSFRALHPAVTDQYSWFDYRSRMFEQEPRRGLRIDHLLVSAPLKTSLQAAGIDLEIRAMEKPSDHAPVWATFDLA